MVRRLGPRLPGPRAEVHATPPRAGTERGQGPDDLARVLRSQRDDTDPEAVGLRGAEVAAAGVAVVEHGGARRVGHVDQRPGYADLDDAGGGGVEPVRQRRLRLTPVTQPAAFPGARREERAVAPEA